MASASLSPQQLLSCLLCGEVYNDDDRKPKYLACHHTFCSVCLQKLWEKTGRYVECSNCRAQTEVAAKGVDGLQTNHDIVIMRKALEKLTTHGIQDIQDTQDTQDTQEGCSKHARQPLFFYCVTCETSICRDCTVLDHREAKGHDIQDIADAKKRSLELLAEVEEDVVLATQKLLETVQTIYMDIFDVEVDSKKGIASKKEDSTIRIEAILEEQKLFIEKATLKCGDDVNKLNVSKEEVLKRMKALPNVSEIRKVVEIKGVASGIEAIKQSMAKDLLEIRKKYKRRRYRVSSDNAVACQRSSAKITLYSDAKKLLASTDAAVVIKIQNQDNDEVKTTTTALEDDSFVVSFIPKHSGKHKGCFKVGDGMLEEITFQLNVNDNNPVKTFGGRDYGNGVLSDPRAVVVDRGGNYYVADKGNGMIKIYDSEGKCTKQINVRKTNFNKSVHSIALDEATHHILYLPCGCTGSNRGPIRRYDLRNDIDSVFIQCPMQDARDFTVNSQQHVIVADAEARCLLVFGSNGKLVRRIGDDSMFGYPSFVTTDAHDNIYVSDQGNHCIFKLNPAGELILLQIGKKGNGSGELKYPQGVATDGTCIAVADAGNHRLQLFSMDGGCAGIIGSEGDRLGLPLGVAITHAGEIAVVDNASECIKAYKCEHR